MACGVCTGGNEQLRCPCIGDFDWWLLRVATVACKCACFGLWLSFSEKLALAGTSSHSSCQTVWFLLKSQWEVGAGCSETTTSDSSSVAAVRDASEDRSCCILTSVFSRSISSRAQHLGDMDVHEVDREKG